MRMSPFRERPAAFILFAALAMPAWSARSVAAQTPTGTAGVERDVVYGMHSGLALLLDVHKPTQPNGYGVIAIFGSGWHSPREYDAAPLKDHAPQLRILVAPLVSAGYTVFAINHRAAPTFRYPAAIEDAERAVRWIRASASRFAIAPDHIGAIGASSGGHLVSMLGVGREEPVDDDASPIDRQSARVQAVVAMCTPSDLRAALHPDAISSITSFLGVSRFRPTSSKADWHLYEQASPILRITPGAAPILLVHGDKDGLIPIDQSEKMEAALRTAGIPARLIRLPGAGHQFEQKPELPDFTGEMIRWFDVHLRGRKG